MFPEQLAFMTWQCLGLTAPEKVWSRLGRLLSCMIKQHRHNRYNVDWECDLPSFPSLLTSWYVCRISSHGCSTKLFAPRLVTILSLVFSLFGVDKLCVILHILEFLDVPLWLLSLLSFWLTYLCRWLEQRGIRWNGHFQEAQHRIPYTFDRHWKWPVSSIKTRDIA